MLLHPLFLASQPLAASHIPERIPIPGTGHWLSFLGITPSKFCQTVHRPLRAERVNVSYFKYLPVTFPAWHGFCCISPKEVIVFERRKQILRLQWLLVIGTSTLLIFNDPDPSFSFAEMIVVVFFLANIIPFHLPLHYFQKPLLFYVLVLFDVLVIFMAIMVTEKASSDLHIFFFLILIMAAIGRSLGLLLLGSLAICGLYTWTVYSEGPFILTSDFLVRIPFLFIVGLFFGYLVYFQKGEPFPAKTKLTVELFDFGKALARAPNAEALYAQIPRLVSRIMGTDACELVIIDRQQIKQRTFQDPTLPNLPPTIDVDRSIHKKVYDSENAYLSERFQNDPNFIDKMDFSFYPYRKYMAKSWQTEMQPSAVLAVYRKEGSWDTLDQNKFELLVGQASLALENMSLLQKLESQSRSDGLTGLANYRYFCDRVEEELSRADRQKYPLSIVMVDLDHLKKINDTHGHQIGDKVLERVGKLLKNITRRMDITARYGGDKFAVVLPASSAEQAQAFSNRLISEVESLKFEEIPEISICVGGATFPGDGDTVARLIGNADQALDYAKTAQGGTPSHSEPLESSQAS